MRRLFFFSSGAMALVVGCGLVGTYDYDDYAGIPQAESSSSSGTAGAGGMGGTGGTGGMTPECPPEGGTTTPDLCDNGVDEDCSGGDCTVNAEWSGRYGNDTHQQVQAIVTTSEGGIALIGKFNGLLDVGGFPLMAPDSQIHSYVSRLNADLSPKFSKAIALPGNVEGIAVQGDATFITGNFPPAMMGNGDTFIRKLNNTGSYSPMDGGWEVDWLTGATISGTAIGTTNFVGAPVFVAGKIGGVSSFPPNCANKAPTLDMAKNYAFLMSVAPKDKDCIWGTAFEGAIPLGLAVTTNTLAITGLYIATDVTKISSSFITAYHPATHKLQWSTLLVPDSPSATKPYDYVSLLSVAVDDVGNAYVAGTFKGKVKINDITYVSEDMGSKSDLFVVAFDGANGGKVLWFDHFGGPDLEMAVTQIPHSIILTKDGLYFSGRTPAGMAIEPGKPSGPICKFSSCAFVMKLDPTNGKTIWARELGENETTKDGSFRLAASSDSLWLGGGWEKEVNLGKLLPAKGNQDVILARFSPLP